MVEEDEMKPVKSDKCFWTPLQETRFASSLSSFPSFFWFKMKLGKKQAKTNTDNENRTHRGGDLHLG